MATTDTSAQAEALRIAERILIKIGWKFTAKDVGETAKEILDALNQKAAPAEEPRP